MRKLISFLFCLFVLSSAATARAQQEAQELTDAKAAELSVMISPRLEGDTLLIKGRIDSHIYDYLAYASAAELQSIRVVDFDSLGGNVSWALEIAEKLKALGKVHRLRAGNFCASACVFLFAAGKERLAAPGTWFGIHGARLGAGYTTSFEGYCFLETDDGPPEFAPRKKGCQDFLSHWYAVSLKATEDSFSFMEGNGIARSLREAYFSLADDPEWYFAMNVIRKPDWILRAEEAGAYALVTGIIQ